MQVMDTVLHHSSGSRPIRLGWFMGCWREVHGAPLFGYLCFGPDGENLNVGHGMSTRVDIVPAKFIPVCVLSPLSAV